MPTRTAACMIMTLALTALISACGPADSQGPVNAQATYAAATQLAAERLPTLEAIMTEYAATSAAPRPGYEATATARMATAAALAENTTPVTLDPALTLIWPTIDPLVAAATGSAAPPPGGYTGGDQHDTVAVYTIRSGEAPTAQINKVFDAHSWLFEGAAGQVATIQATGQGSCDPQIMLIDPAGYVLALNDDGGGGFNARITYTLPSTGTYTIRVTVWKIGTYVLALLVE